MPLCTVISQLDPGSSRPRRTIGAATSGSSAVVAALPMPGAGSRASCRRSSSRRYSTFTISQKLGGTNNAMMGDVIELQFKGSINQNLGAAMSLILMVLVFISIWLMNRFTDDGDEGVATI
ncbi:MAG: hypothetical protein ACLTSG_05225 [Lachnospiraceae bacterium]